MPSKCHSQAAPATLLKKRLWHRCFSVNFAKFLKTPFHRTRLCDCLLCLITRHFSLPFRTPHYLVSLLLPTSCFLKVNDYITIKNVNPSKNFSYMVRHNAYPAYIHRCYQWKSFIIWFVCLASTWVLVILFNAIRFWIPIFNYLESLLSVFFFDTLLFMYLLSFIKCFVPFHSER